MFRNLLSRLFTAEADAPILSPNDAEMAVAALMIRVARADDCYTDTERRRVEAILSRRGGNADDGAAERRAAAEMIEAEAPDTVGLTRTIKARVPLEERQQIVGALWDIALTDGARSPEEEAIIRLVSGLLGVPDRDSALARQQILNDGASV